MHSSNALGKLMLSAFLLQLQSNYIPFKISKETGIDLPSFANYRISVIGKRVNLKGIWMNDFNNVVAIVPLFLRKL